MKLTRKSVLMHFAAVFTLIVLWEIVVVWTGMNQKVFPGPELVFESMWELIIDGTLAKHSVASLFRVTVGFYLAILFGIPLGLLLGRLNSVKALLNPVIHFLRPISPLAWIPLAMIFFGIGDKPAIFLIFLSSFFPIVVSTTAAVFSISQRYFHVAANFHFNRYEKITKIIIPAILPSVFTSLRISMGIAWVVVVAAEMIAVKSGLGYLILDSRNALRMDCVVVGMIVIGAIGLVLDTVVKSVGKMGALSWGTAG